MGNIVWMSLWSMAVGLQVMIACALVSSFYPIPLEGFLKTLLPFFHDMVRPEREMPIYLVFIAFTVAVQGFLVWRFKDRMADPALRAGFKRRVIAAGIGLLVQGVGIFHIFVHQDPVWARGLLYIGMILFALGQALPTRPLLWPEFFQRPIVRHMMEGAALVLTFLMLYVPDAEFVTARIYMGDQFQHFDQSLAGPAWAFAAGNVLNVDTISPYGLGPPILIAAICKFFLGGVGHVSIFTALMWAVAVYFLCWYILLKMWLKSTALACVGVWIAIKIQMFHPTVFPFALTYPSTTVIRFWWDIVFFICAWRYLDGGRTLWLWLAGAVAGLAVAHMSSTGLCLAAVFGVLLFAHWLCPRKTFAYHPSLAALAGYGLSVPAVAFALLIAVQGKYMWSGQFWHNISEFNNYFLSGFGTVPVYESLQNKNFWAFAIGCFIPLVYLWTVVTVGTAVYLGRRGPKDLLAVLLAVYGLLLYHYYIARSAPTSYYAVSIAFVAVVCFWFSQARLLKSPAWRAAAAAAALLWVWVNPQFAAYPNIFNPLRHYSSNGLGVLPLPDGKFYFNHTVAHTARIPAVNSLGESDEGLLTEGDFTDVGVFKDFFRRTFDFTRDARLIDSLTGPEDKVALLSSFDVRILMQAQRRPFFYHYPVFLSRPMRMHSLAVPAIYTVDQLKHTIQQLEEEKPPYLFIERIYSKENIMFADRTHALQWLLLYVHTHYEPVAQGQYLVALQRRAP